MSQEIHGNCMATRTSVLDDTIVLSGICDVTWYT